MRAATLSMPMVSVRVPASLTWELYPYGPHTTAMWAMLHGVRATLGRLADTSQPDYDPAAAAQFYTDLFALYSVQGPVNREINELHCSLGAGYVDGQYKAEVTFVDAAYQIWDHPEFAAWVEAFYVEAGSALNAYRSVPMLSMTCAILAWTVIFQDLPGRPLTVAIRKQVWAAHNRFAGKWGLPLLP